MRRNSKELWWTEFETVFFFTLKTILFSYFPNFSFFLSHIFIFNSFYSVILFVMLSDFIADFFGYSISRSFFSFFRVNSSIEFDFLELLHFIFFFVFLSSSSCFMEIIYHFKTKKKKLEFSSRTNLECFQHCKIHFLHFHLWPNF